MRVHLVDGNNQTYCSMKKQTVWQSTYDAESVTCIDCLDEKVAEYSGVDSIWTKRFAELQQTVPQEFEQVFKDDFNDILA